MNRSKMLELVKSSQQIWDFVIIGGGATGIGCAVDAASRGFSVLLLEKNDFGKGTSSRSTKIVHGGVRYLAQGNISLVIEALRERGTMLKNAPHLVRKQAFIVPVYNHFDKFFYGFGLKIYNLISGKYSFGKSRFLSKEQTISNLPNVKKENLKGGILYFDGQFDDTRFLINLARTALEKGAVLLNYAEVFGFEEKRGIIETVKFQDIETREIFSVKAKSVINATGAFCDSIRRISDRTSSKIVAPSQGIHLVFDRKFLSSENALMIPKTSDGRVIFAIPFQNKTLIGTTDTPIENADEEPRALESEVEFILKTVGDYLEIAPERKDISSIFAGIRPLVKSEKTKNTAKLSRDHLIEVNKSNLLTITGGKWTTYRKMAEDAVNQSIKLNNLSDRECVTKNLKIFDRREKEIADLISENPKLADKIHENFPYRKAEIINAVRNEMARTVEDILARRLRLLFLDAKAAVEIAPLTAEIMAKELRKNSDWIDKQIQIFRQTAKNYYLSEIGD